MKLSVSLKRFKSLKAPEYQKKFLQNRRENKIAFSIAKELRLTKNERRAKNKHNPALAAVG